MINVEKTIEQFGYNPDDLKLKSHKLVIHNCDECGKERSIKKYTTLNTRFCLICANKGIRSSCYKDGRFINRKPCQNCGNEIKYGSLFCRKCRIGKNHHRYIDGRSPLVSLIRSLKEYKHWRTEVFRRDGFTCCECDSSKSGSLEAHHKEEFHILLADFLKEYDQFSPIEDKETLVRLAIKWQPFWNIDNEITLCKDCHKVTHVIDRKDM